MINYDFEGNYCDSRVAKENSVEQEIKIVFSVKKSGNSSN